MSYIQAAHNPASSDSVGETHCCRRNIGKIIGLVALVIGVALVAFAAVLASGHFGNGTMAIIAGGLIIASMIPFGAAAILLTPKPPKR